MPTVIRLKADSEVEIVRSLCMNQLVDHSLRLSLDKLGRLLGEVGA